MSWRTVVIGKRAKLDLSMGYMEVRDIETTRIHLSELHTLIIESTAVSITACLLSELMSRKVKIIFCDEKRNPQGELLPYYGSFDTSAKVRQQASWAKETKAMVWAEIIQEKIHRQQALLEYVGETERAAKLGQYAGDVLQADAGNREGHAAKVYFGGLFGSSFSRVQDHPINAALNYGYSILLSAFNREIVAAGYITQMGIFHDNMFNPFNLACDLMEPFRPLVDRIVWDAKPQAFDKAMRLLLVDMLNDQVTIGGNKQYVSMAIRIFTRSALEAMNQKSIDELKFYQVVFPTLQAKVHAALSDDGEAESL